MCFMKAVGLNKIWLCCILMFYVNNSFWKKWVEFYLGLIVLIGISIPSPPPGLVIIKICQVLSGMKFGSTDRNIWTIMHSIYSCNANKAWRWLKLYPNGDVQIGTSATPQFGTASLGCSIHMCVMFHCMLLPLFTLTPTWAINFVEKAKRKI
jgi:hypothetical protein